MKNQSKSTKAKSLTPSTLKLNQMMAGRERGMLTQEEIELLRKSKKEISEACKNARNLKSIESMGSQQKSSINGFIGMLAGKTKKIASLKEIKKAIAEAWGNG